MKDEISFEWDSQKALINLKKHGISFEEARTVFFDENAVLFDDPEHSDKEDRFLMIGLSNHLNLLIVSHCIRRNNTIRIISSRKATKRETTIYTNIQKRWGTEK